MAHSTCTWISGTTCPHTGTRCACASRCDLAPRRHATDPGQIENEHIDGLSFQELPEGVEVIQVLAGGDRDVEPAAKLGKPGELEMVAGSFQPRDPRVLDSPARASRPGH